MKNIAGIFFGIMLFLLLAGFANALEYESPIVKVTLLNQDPNPARSGDTFQARLRIENTGGGTVGSLQVEVMQDYPFTVIDGPALQDLGTLYEYQTGKNYVNVEYRLKVNKDAVKGQHEFKVRYRQGKGEWTIVTFNIGVTSKEFAQIIYVDKAKIEPGKETDMKFTVTNIGSAPLQNMVFSWSEANGIILPVFSDDTKYIKYLDIGESIDLAYKVIADVNAKPGLYQLDLNLKYEASNATTTAIKTKAGIFVGGETDFDVAFSESNQGQTSLSVANTGNNPALSVSVRIPNQPNFRLSGSNSAIIGNLDKGDYTIVSFQITSSTSNLTMQGIRQSQQKQQSSQDQISQQSGAARLGNGGGNNLRVIIEYTDTTGERRNVEKNVQIQFRSATIGQAQTFGQAQQQSFFGSGSFYAISAIVVIVAIAVVFRKKFAKKK